MALTKRMALIGSCLLIGAAAVQVATSAEPRQQFIPVLSYRTGTYSDIGSQWANGYIDYLKLTNRRGGINGVQMLWQECETGLETSKTLKCYESLKGIHGGAALIQPPPTGAAFALTERVVGDQIPLVLHGYGRSEYADGVTFKWNFTLGGIAWSAADIVIQEIAEREGKESGLRGKKLLLLHHDSPFGSEPVAMLLALSQRYGFELQTVSALDSDQAFVWNHIHRSKPHYVIVWGWGPTSGNALRGAQSVGFPIDRLYGGGWTVPDEDFVKLGADARGYNAVVFHLNPTIRAGVLKEILERVYAIGLGTGQQSLVGKGAYMHGVLSAMLGVEGIRTAQERYGVGAVMNGTQVRWGLENLSLTLARLDALGFDGVIQPVRTSCADHMGSVWGRIQTWDGSSWKSSGEWKQADGQLIRGLLRTRSPRFAPAKQLSVRRAEDCQQ